MTLIARDLMAGNPRLAELGFPEQARGHNAIAGGFQGQRQWTDHFPNGDFMEAMLCSSFDWDGIRQPYVFATENDALNAVSMLFGHLLTGSAQLFSDVRTYWSSASIKRVSGRDGRPMLHLINSGPSALDWTGGQSDANGHPTVKSWWDVKADEASRCLAQTAACCGSRWPLPSRTLDTTFSGRCGTRLSCS
jgi:L-fucose isomerase